MYLIRCSNCEEPLDGYSPVPEYKTGACCSDLPASWGWDAERHAFVSPREFEDDYEDDDYCDCWDCRYDNGELGTHELIELEADDPDARAAYRTRHGE